MTKKKGVSWELPDKPEMKWNFTILLPDIPGATSMSMYGSLDELEDASGPSKEIFTIELRVEELREEIKAFMMARDAGEGGFISTEKIVDMGQSSECWNIVLLSEGYRGDELATFHEHAGSFVNRLRRFTPFDELWNFINIHLINVASIDSGMADPNDPDDNPRTFFDARFYNFTINDRLIVADQNLAQRVVNQHIPEFDLVMMIINTPLFGGSGGRVSVFSSHPLSSKIGLHEMGHTAFGLADEYEFPRSNGRIGEIYDGPPRSEPNIATSIERAKRKWGHLIDDLEDMPIFRNPSCSEFSPSPPFQMHGKVGAFEGAFHHHCGIFRPESDCVMRSLSQDSFCRVCSDRIRRIISKNI